VENILQYSVANIFMDNKYKILSELAWFCRQCEKNIWCVLAYAETFAVLLQNSNADFYKLV